MLGVEFDSAKFLLDMQNIVEYSVGYLEGIQAGKEIMLQKLGKRTKELLGEFIDINARVDPARLHHVYEWYEAGTQSSRLFDITYKVSNGGLTFNFTFTQSKSFSKGSNSVFYDKAKIMEKGIPVTIKPKNASVLAYEDNGEMVFTKGTEVINAPGGKAVQGAFSATVDDFFNNYLTQTMLYSGGFYQYIKTPLAYKAGMSRGKASGKAAGKEVGYNWIVKAGDQL